MCRLSRKGGLARACVGDRSCGFDLGRILFRGETQGQRQRVLPRHTRTSQARSVEYLLLAPSPATCPNVVLSEVLAGCRYILRARLGHAPRQHPLGQHHTGHTMPVRHQVPVSVVTCIITFIVTGRRKVLGNPSRCRLPCATCDSSRRATAPTLSRASRAPTALGRSLPVSSCAPCANTVSTTRRRGRRGSTFFAIPEGTGGRTQVDAARCAYYGSNRSHTARTSWPPTHIS